MPIKDNLEINADTELEYQLNWSKVLYQGIDANDWIIHSGDWVVDDNIFGDNWISKVVGTTKTKAEAQAIVDGEIEDAQDAWDANNVDGETSAQKIARLGAKPVKYNLP